MRRIIPFSLRYLTSSMQLSSTISPKIHTSSMRSSSIDSDSKPFEHSHWRVASKRLSAKERDGNKGMLEIWLPVRRSRILKMIFPHRLVLGRLSLGFLRKIVRLQSVMTTLTTKDRTPRPNHRRRLSHRADPLSPPLPMRASPSRGDCQKRHAGRCLLDSRLSHAKIA